MSQVTITMPHWKHKALLEKIDTLKNGMRFFKINEQFKKAFMDDLFSIERTIKHSSKETFNDKTHI